MTEFGWISKTNGLIKSATEALFENNDVVEKGICFTTEHGDIAFTKSELQRMINEISDEPEPEGSGVISGGMAWGNHPGLCECKIKPVEDHPGLKE